MSQPAGPDESTLRQRAERRLAAKRGFAAHALAYVLVNAGLVVVWAWGGGGFFWPALPLLGWGIGLAFNAFDVYYPGPSEERVRAEMERLRPR
jgi:hypothetical protein